MARLGWLPACGPGQEITINDICLYLRLEVPCAAKCGGAASPGLHYEQVKQQHDGYIVDLRGVRRKDRREADGARGVNVDFDAAAEACQPGRWHIRILYVALRYLEYSRVVSVICIDYGHFDTLGVGIRVDVDVLHRRSKVLISVWV